MEANFSFEDWYLNPHRIDIEQASLLRNNVDAMKQTDNLSFYKSARLTMRCPSKGKKLLR